MKKYVLFWASVLVSSFVFSQNQKMLTKDEIAEALNNRVDLKRVFAERVSVFSEMDKLGYIFIQETDEFRIEESSFQLVKTSEANAVNVGENGKSPSLLKMLVGFLVFVLFFVIVPIISTEWDIYGGHKKKY